jgi:hypothetical protein
MLSGFRCRVQRVAFAFSPGSSVVPLSRSRSWYSKISGEEADGFSRRADEPDVGVFHPPTDPAEVAEMYCKHNKLTVGLPLRKPLHPVVLCHGMGGDMPFLPYFYGIADDLCAGGVPVYQTQVCCVAVSGCRSRELFLCCVRLTL